MGRDHSEEERKIGSYGIAGGKRGRVLLMLVRSGRVLDAVVEVVEGVGEAVRLCGEVEGDGEDGRAERLFEVGRASDGSSGGTSSSVQPLLCSGGV